MKIIPIYITNESVRAFDKVVCSTPELRDELCRVNNVGEWGEYDDYICNELIENVKKLQEL